MPLILVNRAPVLTLWAAVIAERLGQPADTALTLRRAVAGSAARVKARSIGREERKADPDAETPRLRLEHRHGTGVPAGERNPPAANRHSDRRHRQLCGLSRRHLHQQKQNRG
jgi:hypothetical protein